MASPTHPPEKVAGDQNDPEWEKDSFDEEPVEEIWKTLPVRPGHFLDPSRGVDPDTTCEVRADTGLSGLLERHHRALLRRLDHQEELLRQLLVKPARPSSVFGGRQLSDGSARKGSNERVRAEPPVVPPPVAAPTFTPQTPKLFKSFSDFNLSLQMASASANSTHNKRKFSVNGGQPRALDPQQRQSWAQKLVEHAGFDVFFALVVVANSVFIGVEVEAGISDAGARAVPIKIFHYSFTALFTLELLLRVLAHGRAVFCSEDGAWNLLDAVIVATSLAEVAADILYALEAGDVDSVGGLSGLKAFRIIRITRIVKTVRLMRIFRFVMALRMLISSIMHTLKSLFWALMLLMLIVYVFSILFVQSVNSHHFEDTDFASGEELQRAAARYFDSLGLTMLSLFMSIAGGVSWENVVMPLRAISSFWVLCYLFYVSFTYFAVLNVVTAVFCHSAIDGAQNDHANVVHSILSNKESHIKKMRHLFSELGAGETGVITYIMFEEKMSTPAVREYFQSLGLDVWDAWSFFKLLDMDADSEVDCEEFLMGCLRLRGQARAVDVEKVIHDQTWLIQSQSRFQSFVELELASLKDLLKKSPSVSNSPGIFNNSELPRLSGA